MTTTTPVTTHQEVSADDPRLKDGWLVRQLVALAVGLAVLAVLPLLISDRIETVAVRTLIFAIMAVGWNLMSGYGGMFSFGHAAFFGIGAYTDAYLLNEHGVSPWISLAVAAVLAAVVGMLIAYLCLRYRLAGAYFALATFAFAQMFLLLVQNLGALNKTEGFNIAILPSDSWAKMQFQQGSPNYFWIPLGILAVGVLVTILFSRSRSGQFVQAARDDETAAASLGISAMRHRLLTVALSCGITAMAGVYYTQYYLFVGPNQAFGSQVSIEAIVPAVIGGIGTVWGPVIGAAIIGPLSEVSASLLRNPPPFLDFLQGTAGLDVTLYAVILIAIVLFLPKGVFGSIRDRWRR